MNHALPNLALPVIRPLKPIRMRLIILHSLHNLIPTRHHKRPILHNRLVQRHARHKNKPALLLGALIHRRLNAITLLLKHNIVVRLDRAGLGARRENRRAVQDIRKRVPALGQRLLDAAAGLDGDVEQPDRRVCQLLEALGAVGLAADDLDEDLAVVARHLGDLLGAQVAVARLAGFELLGQIDPELHAHVGRAVLVLARHLGVHDAPARGHELQVAGFDGPGVAGEVFVVDGAGEEVGDGFLPAVGIWSC
jgi:hypothetical protein